MLADYQLVSPRKSSDRSVAANLCLSAFSFVFISSLGYNYFERQPVRLWAMETIRPRKESP